MADRLTRRERAAMRLALEVLRFDVRYRGSPRCPLEAETDVHEAAVALRIGSTYELVDAALRQVNCYPLTAPLVRARLALYLRARLRADADWDERAPWWCLRCGALRCTRLECEGAGEHSRIRPLWEQAPAHEEDR